MQLSDFYYSLPPELIAQVPLQNRSASRLLRMSKSGELCDMQISNIGDELRAGDLLVLNDTKVIPARLHGHKDTGGKVEIVLERVLSQTTFLAQAKSSKALKCGQRVTIVGDDCGHLIMQERCDSFFVFEYFGELELLAWFEQLGQLPLPPYIERAVDASDSNRYQTVFGEKMGAVAAPTAGLHYDAALLAKLEKKGVQIAKLTLHVGAGTYQPVRVNNIAEHSMHSEWIDVRQSLCDCILATKENGGRIVAVGTTVVRSLETMAQYSQYDSVSNPVLKAFTGDTNIFITPGFDFKLVDILQTNFHLPESTLLMLVSAFAGYENIMRAYQHAIQQGYRFFSYGDAMLLYASNSLANS